MAEAPILADIGQFAFQNEIDNLCSIICPSDMRMDITL